MWRNEQNLKANSPFSGMRKHFELNSSSHQHDWRQENGFISVNCGINHPSRITWSHCWCGSLNDNKYRRYITSVFLWTVAQPVWTMRCVRTPVCTNAKADVKWRSSAFAACMGLKRTKRLYCCGQHILAIIIKRLNKSMQYASVTSSLLALATVRGNS